MSMTRNEVIEKLGVTAAAFKFILRKSSVLGCRSNRQDNYSESEFRLIKNYLDAIRQLDESRLALGWTKRDKNGLHLPKHIAVKTNRLFKPRAKYNQDLISRRNA